MAHPQQRIFIGGLKDKYKNFFNNKKVLDIGSLNINGTMRDFFENCDYTGIDVGEGPGVDIVCQGQDYDAPNESYDVVCSSECFEHNPYWIETFENMIRMCKKGGLVFFTCATDGRAEHGTERTTPNCSPLTVNMGWTYYRNLTENDFREKINFDDYFSVYGFSVNLETFDLYFWGIKRGSIPVIGIPIVNGSSWLQRLLDSIDYPVDEVFVINNSSNQVITDEIDFICNKSYEFIKKINLTNLPHNIGVASSWNLIIKCYLYAPFWVISNHDVCFTPGFLEKMMSYVNNDDIIGVIGSWDCFLIKDCAIQKCGLFDENFYPAYFEDSDYEMRMMREGISRVPIDYSYYHGEDVYSTTGSQTWRTDLTLKPKLDYSRECNQYYIAEKWGENWLTIDWWNYQHLSYNKPFNNETLPYSCTTYDLKFVRRKSLGF